MMGTMTHMFDEHESQVRSYCRKFPAVFATAQGCRLMDADGRSYLDLLSGAGSLNYGHNNPAIMDPVMAYMAKGGVIHGLDLYTTAKSEFIETFQNVVLKPRSLRYKLQFPGPTGTNAVEAALKLARKVTGRHQVIAFTNGFHGMTLGALAATTNASKRRAAGVSLGGVTFMPYDGYLPNGADTVSVISALITGAGSGADAPAAILVETVQGEGGLNAASVGWLKAIARIAEDVGALLIIDDIQAGNGRTGRFFSFEGVGIHPDIVVLSKSLSGFGAPMSLVLIAPEHDVWQPGEHNGTFRGNNLAFVGATAAINTYWRDNAFQHAIEGRARRVLRGLQAIADSLPPGAARMKGRGLMVGIEFADPDVASGVSQILFADGVIMETCGHSDQVLKFLPPLIISEEEIDEALHLISRAVLRQYRFAGPALASTGTC
jgi:diaminobutyrate-2-oxoglutarate transaminase